MGDSALRVGMVMLGFWLYAGSWRMEVSRAWIPTAILPN